MLNMDQIDDIKKAALSGMTVSAIAATRNIDRKTVRKYILFTGDTNEGHFPAERTTAITAYEQDIEDLLLSQSAITAVKHKLTAKRIHAMLLDGTLCDKPPIDVSIRTVERLVKKIRARIRQERKRKHLKLEHLKAEAQLDFGEVQLFINGTPCKHAILILTMPYSNLRMAHLLPAQNFECLAKGLSQIFEEMGRVPQRIRCDNMKTAVTKIILRDKLPQEADVWDAMDHPRRLNDDFKQFMYAYGFIAEFCNASAGYEKGSVENAVGWIRRNCFIPTLAFDGDYVAINQRLAKFCWKASKNNHYYFREKTIEELFAEEKPRMLTLPDKPYEASTWTEATVSNTCRVTIDKNEYQVDSIPGQKLKVRKTWNRLDFYETTGKFISSHKRSYDIRKDFVDWTVELQLLTDRPSALKNSSFGKLVPSDILSYLTRLNAPKRKTIFAAVSQRISNGELFEVVLKNLTEAIRRYGNLPVADVVNGFRGINDIPTDEIPQMQVPSQLAGQQVLPRLDINKYSPRSIHV